MSGADIQSLVLWWLWLLISGGIFLPLTARIFKSFPDRGYLFAKVMALCIVSYAVYLLGIFHIAPFTHATIILVMSFFLAVNVFFFRKEYFRNSLRLFLGEEVLFASMLALWTYIRSFQPDIFGLEKYMDFGFLNTILRSTYFPPKDMWYTPYPINYYYFGHLTTAVLTKLSLIPATITYNLMIATLFAFCFSLVFSFTYTLIRLTLEETRKTKLVKPISFLGGILGAFLVACGGNLHTIYAFFTAYPNDSPVPFWKLAFAPFSFPNAYWYPNATRFIYHTIHEFPIYSFIVSDLHGHVLDIPNVLLFLALAFIFVTEKRFQKITRSTLLFLIFLGFLVSVLYMTNAWDSLIYLGLWAILLFIFLKDNWKTYAVTVGVPLISFYLFSRPFSYFFRVDELVSGIGIMCAPTPLTNLGKLGPFLFEANHCDHSPLYQLFILWGIPFILFIAFILFLRKQRKHLHSTDIFITCLFAFGFFLIIIPEFAYMKDIYPTYYRANTMFKLVYQSFMLFGIAVSYAIVRISTSLKKFWAIFFVIGTLILLTPSFIYPYLAVPSYYGNFTKEEGLYGLNYLKQDYPSDYAAILWLNTHISGQPVILEAQGDSYTNYARVSANTGLPTVLGWTVHEWLWRGSYSPLPPRMQDIQTMYETHDLKTAANLLHTYNVQLVFVGSLERTKYTNLYEDKFYQLGKLLFSDGQTQIFEIN